MLKPVVAAGFLALNFYVYHFFATDEVRPPRESFASFPLTLGDWRCAARERMDRAVERNLGVSDYLICTYLRNGSAVGVYVGYHASQVRKKGGGGQATVIHPPKHCLPGSGWDIIGAGKVQIDTPGLPVRPATVNRLTVAKGDYRQLVYYWYQSRGRVIADDWEKIVDLFWDRATQRRTDGSLVRFTIPLRAGQEQRAERDFRELASLLLPRLPDFVPE